MKSIHVDLGKNSYDIYIQQGLLTAIGTELPKLVHTDKIAIIVPCYNVENYLARCLDSLLSQTYDNLEVIMVEDCSTDNTKDIVLRYENKYKKIQKRW